MADAVSRQGRKARRLQGVGVVLFGNSFRELRTTLFIAPDHITMAHGGAEGRTPLNAFDNALMAAGIHNLNLMRVSSIVPKDARFGDLPALPVGNLTPTVYSQVTSHISGETISACVGAGIGRDGGTLFEYHHEGSALEAERVVRLMIEEGFAVRGWELLETKFATAEHTVDRVGCAVAAAVMWHSSWPQGVGA